MGLYNREYLATKRRNTQTVNRELLGVCGVGGNENRAKNFQI